MNILVFIFSITVGLFPTNSILDMTGLNPFTRIEYEFRLYDLVYLRGDITTYLDAGYGGPFATFPIQTDYTIDIGLHPLKWLEIGFLHTCYHPYLYQIKGFSAKQGTYFGVKNEIYFKIKGEIVLIE